MASASKRKTAAGAKGGSAKKRRSPMATRAFPETAPAGDAPRLVGIGASAGGLEALKKFFGAMPPKTGCVFVVVVHLDPAHRSLMAELLAHVTGLVVEQAHDRQPLEVDHVYVIPPNRMLAIDQGLIRLQEVADRRGLRGSIDHFFRSLAEAERDRAIAIVLSGTGTEGSLGARAIQAEGGLVMAQAPDTATHSDMPSNAIAAGVVDAVLSPEKMPEALLAYLRNTRANQRAAVAFETERLESKRRTTQESAVAAAAEHQLLAHFAPAAVLVRSTGQIVRFYGALRRYLELPSGETTLDVLALAREALRPTLRDALRGAVRHNRRTVLEALDLTPGRHHELLRITVKPVNAPKPSERLWLIIFEEMSAPAARAGAARSRPQRESDLARRLEAELRTRKNEQQRLIEQLEASNLALKNAHEEVVLMNEELRLTNEELNTSKEELQASNEQLITMNAQLQESVHELTEVNDDLANLLFSTDIATVILDTELRIKRFTNAAARVIPLVPHDKGRPLSDLTLNVIDVDLVRAARSVLDTLRPVEREMSSIDGKQYFLRGLPYRTSVRGVQGVVLTLVDVSTLKQAEGALRRAREQSAEDLRRMTRLHALGERLAGPGESRALLEEILRTATEITDAAMGGIQEPDQAGALTHRALLGFEQPFLEHLAHVAPHSAGACSQAMSSRQRVLVEDVATSPVFADSPSQQALLAAGVHAVQSTPLFDRSGGFLGVFSTYYRTPHRFADAELQWLDLLARHASDALERLRTDESLARAHAILERRVAERTAWLTLLHEISQSITEAPTWDAALQRVLQRLCAMEEWQIGYVYLPDPEDPDVIVPTISCVSDERFRRFHEASEHQRYARGARLPGEVYARGVPIWANDREALSKAIPIRVSAAEQAGLMAGVALPVTVGQEVIAVLELFSDRSHPRNDWFDNLMPAVGDHIGRILERERTTARMADLVWREQQDLLHTLHDALGQTLTGLGMLGSGLRHRLSSVDKDAAETATQIAKQAQQALEQVRQLSRSLFPAEVDAESLTAALRELAFTTGSLHKIEARVHGQVPHGFHDGAAATQLYRIAQEAVTNAIKHAQARTITIQIDGRAAALRLQIADDGVGIGKAATGNGIGLQIMRYRAHSIGGILTVESGSTGGTVVTCTLRTAPGRRPSPLNEAGS